MVFLRKHKIINVPSQLFDIYLQNRLKFWCILRKARTNPWANLSTLTDNLIYTYVTVSVPKLSCDMYTRNFIYLLFWEDPFLPLSSLKLQKEGGRGRFIHCSNMNYLFQMTWIANYTKAVLSKTRTCIFHFLFIPHQADSRKLRPD